MPAVATYPLTVYFDATCALCTAEMNAMKARDTTARLNLVDCSPAGFGAGPAGAAWAAAGAAGACAPTDAS
jgi:predicted DCC family thiol-disulfide oxidoreductase YuxK